VLGRPLPGVETTLLIDEIFRSALMSNANGDEKGPLLTDPAHAHDFYLPKDASGDGFIDYA